jgi:hypothetical protein
MTGTSKIGKKAVETFEEKYGENSHEGISWKGRKNGGQKTGKQANNQSEKNQQKSSGKSQVENFTNCKTIEL